MANDLKVEGRLDLGESDTLRLPKDSSDPSSPQEGDMYYNTSSLAVRTYQNGQWQNMIASPSTPNLPQVETFTLSGTDITNKYITLAIAPAAPTKTVLGVIGGPMQSYGTDFQIVSGNRLSWSGLFLDGVLLATDQLVVQYE